MSAWRRWCARWSGAEAALVVAWSAFAAGLLAVALARDSVGAGLLGAFCAWQTSDVWAAVPNKERERERQGRGALGSR
jgi:hypothetical protein